jgi:UDP-N-acetylmuramoylalanine--D-glutamate ligase
VTNASDWSQRRVCVAGIGVSGAAAARVLLEFGASVQVVDGRDGEREQTIAAELAAKGAAVRLGDGESAVDADLVVTSPGWRPDQPLLRAALRDGVEVIGEPELAWRIAAESGAMPWATWIGVTGTNGKTTTVGMLASILRAAGYRTIAAGNVGTPLVEAVLADPPYDVLAVEMSSFQLHWAPTLQFYAAAVLNIAEDHIDWHGSFDAYAADKARIWGEPPGDGAPYVLYNGDDPLCVELAAPFLDRQCFTLDGPEPGCFGVADGLIVDGMSGVSPEDYADPDVEKMLHRYHGVVLASLADIQLAGAHNVANALAAAGLARQFNLMSQEHPVPPRAVAAGLRAYTPGPHRNAVVATVDDVTYVDDSKATNPHAASVSLATYDSVVWIAGGLLKGANVDELVERNVGRLRAAVLIGRDRGSIARAIARHAPDVPVAEVAATDTGAMTEAVRTAARFAVPGDTVLLAPAAASMDMFSDYAARGDAFAAAARALSADGG